MPGMLWRARTRLAATSLGPVLCAVVFLLCPPLRPGFGSGQIVSASLLSSYGLVEARCALATVAESPQLSTPPASKGAFRAGRFSIDLVIVVVERARSVGRARIGGLYGP